MLDQPYGLLDKMTYALNVFNVVRAFKQSDNWAEFAKANPEMAEIYTDVSRMRDA